MTINVTNHFIARAKNISRNPRFSYTNYILQIYIHLIVNNNRPGSHTEGGKGLCQITINRTQNKTIDYGLTKGERVSLRFPEDELLTEMVVTKYRLNLGLIEHQFRTRMILQKSTFHQFRKKCSKKIKMEIEIDWPTQLCGRKLKTIPPTKNQKTS